jgi:hypothetical protein
MSNWNQLSIEIVLLIVKEIRWTDRKGKWKYTNQQLYAVSHSLIQVCFGQL